MLAKMLPPFMFSCDFTHQLGRESSRKPLKPTVRPLGVACGWGGPGGC